MSDAIDSTEAANLPQSVTSKKYFTYVTDNYGSPPSGPTMIDIVEDTNNGQLSVTVTFTEGDTGDLFLIYGNGTKSGNNITFTVPVIMCNVTDPNGTGTATFTGTTASTTGKIIGTFTNILSVGDTCEQSSTNKYEGTFTAEDVTNASPANVAGTYNIYVTPNGGYPEQGPATLQIAQSGSSINDASLTFVDSDTNQSVTVSGQGIVYGNYLMLRIPIIICKDTGSGKAEYASFLGKFDTATNTITGMYGDGVPAGDYCKVYNDASQPPQTTTAEGSWRAVKK